MTHFFRANDAECRNKHARWTNKRTPVLTGEVETEKTGRLRAGGKREARGSG